MRLINLVPVGTKIDFMRFRKVAAVLSLVLIACSAGLFFTKGLNFGIDFRGGILMEVRTQGPADISRLRSTLNGLALGEVQLQEFGQPSDVLIRICLLYTSPSPRD